MGSSAVKVKDTAKRRQRNFIKPLNLKNPFKKEKEKNQESHKC